MHNDTDSKLIDSAVRSHCRYLRGATAPTLQLLDRETQARDGLEEEALKVTAEIERRAEA